MRKRAECERFTMCERGLTVSKQQLCHVFTARSEPTPPGGSTENPTDTRHPLITTHINPSIQLKTELPQRRSLKSNDLNVMVIALIQRSEWNSLSARCCGPERLLTVTEFLVWFLWASIESNASTIPPINFLLVCACCF